MRGDAEPKAPGLESGSHVEGNFAVRPQPLLGEKWI